MIIIIITTIITINIVITIVIIIIIIVIPTIIIITIIIIIIITVIIIIIIIIIIVIIIIIITILFLPSLFQVFGTNEGGPVLPVYIQEAKKLIFTNCRHGDKGHQTCQLRTSPRGDLYIESAEFVIINQSETTFTLGTRRDQVKVNVASDLEEVKQGECFDDRDKGVFWNTDRR
ncbi:hypothetical protein ACOMHN_009511 [Nucella lapillus]